MAWAVDPIDILDGEISVRTLNPDEVEDVAAAIHDPEGFFGRRWGVNTHEKIAGMLHRHLETRDSCNPLVYRVRGEVAGITRFMCVDAKNKSLEIGGTWVAPRWRRTFVNTRVKLQLLHYAFATLGAERVEFLVNTENFSSQMGVLRLGAAYEGIKRRRMLYPDGEARSSLVYSIIQPEWPALQERLGRLVRGELPEERLPSRFATARTVISVYGLADAEEFCELIARNRESLRESFRKTSCVETAQEARAYIADDAHRRRAETDFRYAIRHEGRQIGQLQIKQIDWSVRSAELAYFIDADYRRQGFARESIHAALRVANMSRMILRVLPENLAGIALASSLGFTREGVMKNAHSPGRDIVLFAMTTQVALRSFKIFHAPDS